MAANKEPIFSIKGDISTNDGTTMPQVMGTAAAADFTGISGNYALIFTADSTSGGFVKGLKFVAAGTNVASVARIFVNNGSTNGTAANNTMIAQQSLPATTLSNTSMTAEIYLPLDMALSPGFRIYVGLATAVAAGWVVSADAGQYE